MQLYMGVEVSPLDMNSPSRRGGGGVGGYDEGWEEEEEMTRKEKEAESERAREREKLMKDAVAKQQVYMHTCTQMWNTVCDRVTYDTLTNLCF